MTEKDNFCIAPWIHLHTWPNGNVYPCCMTPMEEPIADLTKTSLKDIWNSQPMRSLRVKMMNNERAYSCRRCYEQEDAGQPSMRQMLNQSYANHLDKPKETDENGYFKQFNLAYWDFRFSNICNFRCRTCGPQLSTGWYEDTKKIWGSLPNDVRKIEASEISWKQIDELFPVVEEIYFAGGEPLLMQEHYDILDRLVEEKRYDVRLRYNTNFSRLHFKSKNVIDYWNKFDSVSIFASLDGSHSKGEYVRKGLNWNTIENNFSQINNFAKNVDLHINYTLSVMNAFHVTEFHREMIEKQHIEHADKFRLNIVQHPLHFRFQILPQEYKEKLKKHYQNYIDDYLSNLVDVKESSIVNDFRSAIALLESEDYSSHLHEFIDHTRQLDRLRKEDFTDIFSEYQSLFDEYS